MDVVDRYIVGRDDNIVHVDFGHEPDPPTPTFPGAGSLRVAAVLSDLSAAIAPELATTTVLCGKRNSNSACSA
jgi:hypothetical protein